MRPGGTWHCTVCLSVCRIKWLTPKRSNVVWRTTSGAVWNQCQRVTDVVRPKRRWQAAAIVQSSNLVELQTNIEWTRHKPQLTQTDPRDALPHTPIVLYTQVDALSVTNRRPSPVYRTERPPKLTTPLMVDVHSEIFCKSRVWRNFQRKVLLFLNISEFPYNTVEGSLCAKI